MKKMHIRTIFFKRSTNISSFLEEICTASRPGTLGFACGFAAWCGFGLRPNSGSSDSNFASSWTYISNLSWLVEGRNMTKTVIRTNFGSARPLNGIIQHDRFLGSATQSILSRTSTSTSSTTLSCSTCTDNRVNATKERTSCLRLRDEPRPRLTLLPPRDWPLVVLPPEPPRPLPLPRPLPAAGLSSVGIQEKKIRKIVDKTRAMPIVLIRFIVIISIRKIRK